MFRRSTFSSVLLTASLGVLALAVLAVFGHGKDEAVFVTDRMIATDNLMMIAASGIIVSSTALTLWNSRQWDFKTFNEVDWCILGFGLEALGWMIHRSYWALWRMARDFDLWKLADSMEVGASLFVTAFGFVLMMLGAIFVLNPFTRRYFGAHWFGVSCILFVAFWLTIYEALGLIRPLIIG